MKTQSRLTKLFVAIAALFTFSSCLDTDDPAFGISGISYYVYQQTVRTGGTAGPNGETGYTDRHYFLPIIQVATNDIASSLTCQSTSGVVTMEPVEGYSNILWATRFSSTLMTGTFPAGTYTIQATNADAEVATYQFSIPDMDPLGYIEITEAPACADGRISVKWAKVDNADEYAVYLFELSEELKPNSSTDPMSAASYDGNGIEFSIAADDMERYGLESGTQYRVCVVAVSSSSSTSSMTGGVGLISYSDKTMITL